MDNSRAVYGIDLGTTYSCIAQVDRFDQAVVLRNFEGDSTTPSAVYFDSDDPKMVVVGKEAKGMLAIEPENTVVFIKRDIGNDDAFDKVNNRLPHHYDPTEISAFILRKLVQDANALGDNPTPINDVVITCPAYFGTKEIMQTKQAGILAGLNVLAIINEPTAAAISYGVRLDKHQTVLVYDLGGGTFDVTYITVDRGAIRVVATNGDHHLGGVDWDTALAKYMLTIFNTQNGTDYSLDDDPILYNSLMIEAEMRKKNLTVRECVNWNFSYKGKNLRIAITRDDFCQLTEDLLYLTIEKTREVLEIARCKGFGMPDTVLLVGGSTLMPQVKTRVDCEFGCDAKFHDPAESVAKGAAIFAMNKAYTKALRDYEDGESDVKPKTLAGDRTTVRNVTSKTYGNLINYRDNDNEPYRLMVRNYIFANSPLPATCKVDGWLIMDNQSTLLIDIYENDYTDSRTDIIVDPDTCRDIDHQQLPLTKNYPKGEPTQTTFSISEEGILSVSVTVGIDRIDFQLHITGVKTEQELVASKSLVMSKTIE